MTRETAKNIAENFIKTYNPNMWDGNGKQDDLFSADLKVINVTDKIYMVILFDIDADEGGKWAHEVKLYERGSDELIDAYFGYGIDSVENMTDTILDLCEKCNVK